MDAVFGHADDIIVLVRGEIIAAGPAGRGARQCRACARSIWAAVGDVGRAPQPGRPGEAAMGDGAILEVEGLDAAYGQAQILFDVSLNAARAARSSR